MSLKGISLGEPQKLRHFNKLEIIAELYMVFF